MAVTMRLFPEADHLEQVVHESPVGWERELEACRLRLVLGGREQNEDERHDEDDPDDRERPRRSTTGRTGWPSQLQLPP